MPTVQYLGHTLTWEEHSPGEHTLVFIHGFSAARQGWIPLLDPFMALGRCVTLDLPGHGDARVPPDYAVLEQGILFDLQARAVQELSGGQPVTLIGHSTGGLVALGVAARLPRVVKRAVSIDGVVWGPLGGLLGTAHWLLGHYLYPAFWALWAFTQIQPWSMMYGLTSYVHDKRALWRSQAAWEMCRQTYPIYRRQRLRNLAILLNLLEKCDVRPLAAGLEIPVLAIAGAQDPIVPCEQVHWLEEHLPNVEVKVIDGVGHAPQLEAAAVWEQTILDWLAAHRVRQGSGIF
jgi:pimeloyl-ACP methyl ester carboxylesterase